MTQPNSSKASFDFHRLKVGVPEVAGWEGYVAVPRERWDRLVAIAEGADLLYRAIDDAHEGGETFPLRVSTCGARLGLALSSLKGAI